MKKLLVLILVLSLVMTACGKTQAEEENGIDYQQFLDSPGSVAYTSDAFYIQDGTVEQRVYFLEQSLQAPVTLLCARADCDHGDANCVAWLLKSTGGGTPAFFGWKDRLYYLESESGFPDGAESAMVLYSMDGRGLDRRKEAELDFDVGTGGTWSTRCACGYITLSYSVSVAERSTDIQTLYLFSMDAPEAAPVVLFTNADAESPPDAQWNEVPRAFPMHVTEDDVFYMVEQMTEMGLEADLYRYQISTGETTLLVEDALWGGDDLALVDGLLYWFDADGALYTIDLTGGGVGKIADIPLKEDQYGLCDDRWLYISAGKVDAPEEAEVVIYDYEGREVQRLSCGELGTSLSVAFTTRDKVFFRVSGLIRHASIAPICYLEKEDIEQGRAEFILLPQP